MKAIWGIAFCLSIWTGSFSHAAPSFRVGILGADLHDVNGSSNDPIEIWRKMRPQDFAGAPTLWQVLV